MSTWGRSAFVFCCVLVVAVGPAAAQGLDRVEAEEQGIEAAPSAPGPVGQRSFQRGPESTRLLLIPESTNDRVMAFDADTGDLVDADFIPADPTNLGTPINAILKGDGSGFLVSDQIEDAVFEYGLDGSFVGLFAPAGGVNTDILDNVRGIAIHPVTGNLLVTVGGGANDDAVAEFDSAGNHVGNFIAVGAGGLDSPFDILLGADALVAGINSDAIHRYDATTGAHLSDLLTGVAFPEQIAFASSNGNLLIANFSSNANFDDGVVEVQLDGTVVGNYDVVGGLRGVHELANGNLLVTDGTGVHEITRANTLVETKITGVSARFIELVEIPGGNLVINEIDYDQAGTDGEEFIEIYNPTGSAVNLDGWVVELVNGSNGSVYDTIALPAVDLAADDYFVICANAATVPNCDLDDDPDTNFIQNGSPDAVGLRDGTGSLIDAVSYEGDTAGYTEGSGTGLEDDSSIDYFSISRFPNGADTDVNNVDLSGRCNSPGQPNFETTTGCVMIPVELMSFSIE